MAKEWEPETIFDVLGSEEVRHILAFADQAPMSVQELATRLDVSEPTIYRRVNTCVKYDLLTAEDRIAEDGNHYKVYNTNLQRICFEIDDGGFDVTITLRQDLVDRFGDFWRDLEGENDDD